MARVYKIEVRETLSRVVEVTAENADAAVSKVGDLYRQCEIVLDAEDYVGVEYLNAEEEENE